MRAVVQRVTQARVEVTGETVGEIEKGLLVYLGVAKADTEKEVATMVNKIAGLRVFRSAEPDDDRMTQSVEDIEGAVLMVSQFTLFGDVRRGRRPSFEGAADPDEANRLYESVITGLRTRNVSTETGQFRAMMDVHSVVDGPVTILIDTTKLF